MKFSVRTHSHNFGHRFHSLTKTLFGYLSWYPCVPFTLTGTTYKLEQTPSCLEQSVTPLSLLHFIPSFMLHALKGTRVRVTLNEEAYATSKVALCPPSHHSIRLADYDAINRKYNRVPSSLVSQPNPRWMQYRHYRTSKSVHSSGMLGVFRKKRQNIFQANCSRF